MVGAAEGPGGHQAAAPGQKPCHRVDLGGFHRFLPGHGGQDAGQPLGQHGFAGAGGADQQDVVAARCRHHHGPPCHRLAQHVCKVGVGRPALVGLEGQGLGGGQRRPPVQGVDHVVYRPGAVHLHPRAAAGLRRFGGIGSGEVQGTDALFGGGQGHGQHPRHRPQGAVQGNLPQEGGVRLGRVDLSRRGQHRQQQGQVVDRPCFADVGGGQVDGHPSRGPAVPQVAGCRPDPVGTLPHRRIRQAYDGKGVHPARHICFHRHPEAFQAVEAKTLQYSIHG